MTNKIYELSDEQFVQLIKESSNIAEVLFKLGYTVDGNSWAYTLIKRRMSELLLTTGDFKGKSPAIAKQNTYPYSEVFKENSRIPRVSIRRRIVSDHLLPYQCAICGISEWNGKTLSLELDHINGINDDNRLENLRFLCPNCHSQTSTYGSRNHKENITKYDITDELRNKVEETYKVCKSIQDTSSKLGVRRKIVRKIVIEAGLKKSNQKYVIRYDKDRNEIKRYGSIAECARDLIDHNELKTKEVKTAKRTINYNKDKFWLNSYWLIMDAPGNKR